MLDSIEAIIADYDFVVAKDKILEFYFGPPYRLLRQISPELTESIVSIPSKVRAVRICELLTERLFLNLPFFDGNHITLVDPLLVKAYSQQGKIGIVSRRYRRRQIEPNLERFGYRNSISVIVGTEDVGLFGTSRKEYIPRCMEMLDKLPGRILFMGDSPEDLRIAKECGAKTCGITGGYHSENSLQRVNPEYGVSTAQKVLKMRVNGTNPQTTYN